MVSENWKAGRIIEEIFDHTFPAAYYRNKPITLKIRNTECSDWKRKSYESY